MLYLDHNATTPVRSDIVQRFADWVDNYGNASSIHAVGRSAKDALESARSSILSALGLKYHKVVFTSGGTESNRLALNQFAVRGPQAGRELILLSAIEHPCIRNQRHMLERSGFRVLEIPVDRNGCVDLHWFEDNANERVACAAVMLANNETGAIQPAAQIGRICGDHGIYFHCDAVQGPGKMTTDWNALRADSITLSAHKFYGLKGAGVLIYREKPEPLFVGGNQENGIRAGTENVFGALMLAECLRAVISEEPTFVPQMAAIRDQMETAMLAIPGLQIQAAKVPRLANTSSLTITGMPNDILVTGLDRLGFCVSTGAACHSGSWEPSHVLLAMGLSHEDARSTIRVSLGRTTSGEELSRFAAAVSEMVSVRV